MGPALPTVVASWRRAWGNVIPFFAFPPEIRRVIYTTNALESLNARIRKIIKTRGHFPNDDAATKLIWLALRNISAAWSRSSPAWRPAMNQNSGYCTAIASVSQRSNMSYSGMAGPTGERRRSRAVGIKTALHTKFRTLPSTKRNAPRLIEKASWVSCHVLNVYRMRGQYTVEPCARNAPDFLNTVPIGPFLVE